MKVYLKSMLEVFGIVYFRFKMIPRIWCVWLVAVNAACLWFISHIEAQVVLAVTFFSVLVQSYLYSKIRFTRIMGFVHVTWIPMFAWVISRFEVIAQYPDLYQWLWILFVTNLISLIVDAVDIYRFYKGEREPYYSW